MSEESGTVADIPDAELLRRVVSNIRPPYGRGLRRCERWIAVMGMFGLGSTYASQLCRRFDLDPHEMVERK